MNCKHRTTFNAVGAALTLLAALSVPLTSASAFCGFYVAQADAKLFNTSSQVVLAWDAGRASVTMASDYEGDPKDFALVVPVPTVVQKRDILVVGKEVIDKLDAYSAPRLSEYFDRDPCEPPVAASMVASPPVMPRQAAQMRRVDTAAAVTIEARYEVGVYDILILSAKESSGLVAWLKANDYRIPDGADAVLKSYIAQGMHFFVAKVNLERHALAGGNYLSPLQVSYHSNKFMLPIRLGTVNAKGPQDLVVFVLSRKGRVETANYQTAKMPSGMGIPLFAKKEFGKIYKAAFDTRVAEDNMDRVYMEYAWALDGGMPCDPCAASVPTAVDLFNLGARWHFPEFATADIDQLKTARFPANVARSAFLTRLHVRYDSRHFPEDLAFIETADRESFQAIYKVTHPAKVGTCKEGIAYGKMLQERFAAEAKALAALTHWDPASIRERMNANGETLTP